ncbi:MAG: rod shape-determining protein MreC [bacterium]|nr:rod shape-determining protein MreC [bacterium]
MSSRRRRSRITRRRVFVGLLFCSAVGLLLPQQFTARLASLFQIVVPFQEAANRGINAVDAALAEEPELSAAEAEHLLTENAALRHSVASLRANSQVLAQANQELTGVRAHGLPGRLIPAHVVTPDALVWRESLLVDAGSLRGVRRLAAVASNHFAVGVGAEQGVRNGQAVLAAEVFVGSVDYAATHTARVRLVSDPSTRMPVQIAREWGDSMAPLDAELFWLVGAGGRRARVIDVDHQYVRDGGIAVDDDVLTVSDPDRLPVPLVIGRITEIRHAPGNPLLRTLEVELALDPDTLRRVYVVDVLGE